MRNKKTFLVLVLAFVLLLVGASILYTRLSDGENPGQLAVQNTKPASQETQPEATEEKKYPAPDFTVYDAQGNQVRLSDYFGKPIVLNFWASWCGPCKMEMPDFQEKYLELGEEVTFLMVNMTDGRETQTAAQAFIEQQGFTFPVLFDLNSNAAMIYRVYSLPTTYFISAQGELIAQATGAISGETLQKGIDMIR